MTRLQKLLASAGLGSRRRIEDWIREGRICIDGRIARLGDQADAGHDIRLDGRKLDLQLHPAAAREVLLYHKPVGEMTTRSDPQGRPTVFEHLPVVAAGRWVVVGRLDVNTSGLLLFTTDGELAHRLMHPSSEIDREYLVRVRGRPSAEVAQTLLAGVPLEDGIARFDHITPLESERTHASFRVVLHEGRNREVRRMWLQVGFEVSRLLRVRYGPLELPRDLRPGEWRKASVSQVEALAAAVHLSARPALETTLPNKT